MVKKRGLKAQSSVEFLLIVGFAMMMILPLVVIFFEQSENLNTGISSSQTDKISSDIVDAADEVYYLGAPSKKTLSLYFPDSIKSAEVSGHSLIFNVDSPNGDYEVVKWSVTNLTGSVRSFPGVHRISVESAVGYDGGNNVSYNYVIITDS